MRWQQRPRVRISSHAFCCWLAHARTPQGDPTPPTNAESRQRAGGGRAGLLSDNVEHNLPTARIRLHILVRRLRVAEGVKLLVDDVA